MAMAGSITTSNGARCDDNYNLNHRSNRSVEFSSSVDTNGNAEFGVSYRIELGKKKVYNGTITRLDCNKLLDIEERKQLIELQRMQMEIELLRKQLEAAKKQTTNASDDW